MKKRELSYPADRKEPLRLLALSDGLFATVLTLLVLDLRIPDALSGQDGGIRAFLNWIGPHLFSYLLTFFVAGIYWLAHHRDFDHVISYDHTLLGYNLLFLLFIGLLPFSTAAVGLVGFKTGTYPFYWAIYCANLILAGLMLTLTWLYAVSHGHVDSEISSLENRRVVARRLVTPAIFLISILMEYLFPRAFLGPYTLLLIPVAQGLVDRFHTPAESGRRPDHVVWSERLWRAGTTLLWLLLIGLAVWTSSL